jgi:hypothetical protein
LLFQVQPSSKKILPWSGAARQCDDLRAVLSTRIAGYAYALDDRVASRWQAVMHLGIVLVAVCLLPLFPPNNWWKPLDGDMPAVLILLLLTAVVVVRYFVVSTSGPMVQAWFARLYPGRSPYRLYSLSNIGSLGALLTYPFLIETTLAVDAQGYVWALLFVGFAALIGILALNMWRQDKQADAELPGRSRQLPPLRIGR